MTQNKIPSDVKVNLSHFDEADHTAETSLAEKQDLSYFLLTSRVSPFPTSQGQGPSSQDLIYPLFRNLVRPGGGGGRL